MSVVCQANAGVAGEMKKTILVGAGLMVVSGISCSLVIAREWEPWLATLCAAGFVAGLATYMVADIVAWWRA